jgi:DNA-directed RNA polymerase
LRGAQDGSCNGLQHYAALARDGSGGQAVNLLPGPAPDDVYSAVSAVVGARVAEDAGKGLSEASKFLHRNGGAVDRKLLKQTIMTRCADAASLPFAHVLAALLVNPCCLC